MLNIIKLHKTTHFCDKKKRHGCMIFKCITNVLSNMNITHTLVHTRLGNLLNYPFASIKITSFMTTVL